jgi:hypothetical protein
MESQSHHRRLSFEPWLKQNSALVVERDITSVLSQQIAHHTSVSRMAALNRPLNPDTVVEPSLLAFFGTLAHAKQLAHSQLRLRSLSHQPVRLLRADCNNYFTYRYEPSVIRKPLS